LNIYSNNSLTYKCWHFFIQVLGGGGTIKADQLHNLLTTLPVALFHTWNIDGEIPDSDAPTAKASTLIARAEARTDALLAKRRKAHLDSLPNPTPADYAAASEMEQTVTTDSIMKTF
jgi:hypothetical protein